MNNKEGFCSECREHAEANENDDGEYLSECCGLPVLEIGELIDRAEHDMER